MNAPNPSNDLPRPDLSPGSTPAWQVALVGGLGALITVGVLIAIQQSYRTAIEVGTVMIVLGLFLAIGLIAERPAVSRGAAVILFLGGIVVLGLGIMDGNMLWAAGGLVILLAGEAVLLKEQFLPRKG